MSEHNVVLVFWCAECETTLPAHMPRNRTYPVALHKLNGCSNSGRKFKMVAIGLLKNFQAADLYASIDIEEEET